MPRFHMNIRKGDELLEDWDGEEFSSLSEARAEAVLSARELMSAAIAAGKAPAGLDKFEIVDESGKTVLTMLFKEAIDVG